MANGGRDFLWPYRNHGWLRLVGWPFFLVRQIPAGRARAVACGPARRGVGPFIERSCQYGETAACEPPGAVPACCVHWFLDRLAVAALQGSARGATGHARARIVHACDPATGRDGGGERPLAGFRSARSSRCAVDHALRAGAAVQARRRRRVALAGCGEPISPGPETCIRGGCRGAAAGNFHRDRACSCARNPGAGGALAVYAAAACPGRHRADLDPFARREGDGRGRDRARGQRRWSGQRDRARRRIPAASSEGGHVGPCQSLSRHRIPCAGRRHVRKIMRGASRTCGFPLPGVGTCGSRS